MLKNCVPPIERSNEMKAVRLKRKRERERKDTVCGGAYFFPLLSRRIHLRRSERVKTEVEVELWYINETRLIGRAATRCVTLVRGVKKDDSNCLKK